MHSGEHPEIDVGLVSDGNGFEDSPDCERITGGVNSKGPRAVAIGRQANLLQWGFYGAPDRMTVPARRAFLNAIVWMQQFRGHRPLAVKTSRSRGWLEHVLEVLENPPVELRTPAAQNSLEAYVKTQFPAEFVADGIDVPKLRQWYRDHEGFLYSADRSGKVAVDEDLLALGLANRDPKLLDWLAATLGRDPADDRALRLARRYLGEHGRDAAAALAFVAGDRTRVFFSDTAGFRWLVDSNPRLAAPPAGAAK